ncbi:hypothetical protein NDU88_005103 [Pleurodeles waltl]|uniref:Uncharacterized protein n=1 Tax=Pleurodeles waltl TaxID=8319 RepID=A0AAV7KZQ0_PLEWA|nr:hypothetical protein NDU88_005103 [Pleurodeles waltl]
MDGWQDGWIELGKCNRAVITTVPKRRPEPLKWCPWGTAGRTATEGESLDPDIRVPNAEVKREEEREWWRRDSLEEVPWTETEWNATSGAGTETREPLG